ncbi:MAG TPA: NADH-quinone oxidoreductase subunit N [Candidatus Saccharimonadales bacterium]|nr:NADH-quinone oxidoreductase subunit N [Candidatus Saccharimonadales bacterium]
MPTAADYIRILPEIVLSVWGMTVMFIEALLPPGRSRKGLGVFAAFGAVAAIAATAYQAQPQFVGFGLNQMLRVDHFSVFFHFIVLFVALATILMSLDYLPFQKIDHGEYYALILLGAVGMCLMSSAVELVLIFIALEISSISSYILAGFRRNAAESAESSLKYFLLGSFATAFFLYGVALLYGATGSTNVFDIAATLGNAAHIEPLAYVAVALIFTGLGFKVACAPFHIWTPDVYEGAPSPVVAFMSTAPKAAAFAVLIRLVIDTASPHWFWVIWIAAVLSMCVGNLGAILQSNVKRMLAYSSIAHAGYLMVAFASASNRELGISAAMFYSAAYAAMNVGAFAVITQMAGSGERFSQIDDYSGLGKRSPLLAAVLTFFLLSLIGIPITGGFFAKFYVFSAALRTHLIWLTIIGVANSGMGSYYYLRLIVRMYMFEPRTETPTPKVQLGMGLAIAISLIATLWLGVLPNAILHYTQGAPTILASH